VWVTSSSERIARSEEVAMHPTIAEQLAAMHRRELQEAAMKPYDTYQLYQIERPKTAAEIRLADEHAGRLAAAMAGLVRQLTGAWRRKRPVPERDGPFAETKEQIAGFDVLECDSLADAVEMASRHPTARSGTFELRPFCE
jgi:hypothetical protein